jgi:hypothetical protein
MTTVRNIIRVLTVLFPCFGAAAPSEPTSQLQSLHEFKVFDGTLYRGKPDMTRYGIEPIEVLYVSRFFQDVRAATAHQGLPNERVVRNVAREARALKRPVVIDIEHWRLDGDEASMRANLSKYATVLQ